MRGVNSPILQLRTPRHSPTYDLGKGAGYTPPKQTQENPHEAGEITQRKPGSTDGCTQKGGVADKEGKLGLWTKEPGAVALLQFDKELSVVVHVSKEISQESSCGF